MHPVLFTIPGINLPVFAYGTALGVSIVAAWFLILHRCADAGISAAQMRRLFLITVAAALIGARGLYLLTHLESLSYGNVLIWLKPSEGGLVAYGGFLGGFVGALLASRMIHVSFLKWADVATPGLALGLGITRIGCLFYGCDYGSPVPASIPGWLKMLGISFPRWENGMNGAPAWLHHVHDGMISRTVGYSLSVWPTQLMESFFGWLCFVLLLTLGARRRFEGQLFLLFALSYGVFRFFIEFLRGDPDRGFLFGLSTSQLIALVSIALIGLIWPRLSVRDS